MAVRILIGDVLDRLADLPDESVHCCVTSPPYYALRNYGVAGQIGLEATPAEYVAKLVDVFREVRRVLRKDGTVWLNIGDSYAGSGMTGGTNSKESSAGRTDRMFHGHRRDAVPGMKQKDLIGIPWVLAFALRDDGWHLRSEIIWAKKAPMPESVIDRPTAAHEKVFLLSKSPRYFYDAEAVKEDFADERMGADGGKAPSQRNRGGRTDGLTKPSGIDPSVNGGRNMRNWWLLGPEPFPEAHFATFPTEIPWRAILAGTSERGVCPKCGAQWERSLKRKPFTDRPNSDGTRRVKAPGQASQRGNRYSESETTGWCPTCDHGPVLNPVPATVLDPFLGAGTTALVADRLGRNCIGIELNPTYAEMAERRIRNDAGLFGEIKMDGAR